MNLFYRHPWFRNAVVVFILCLCGISQVKAQGCLMTYLYVDLGLCDPNTNTFTVTGYFDYINNPGTGTCTVTATNSSGTFTQTFNPPFVNGQQYNYSIPGLAANGSLTTVTVSFSNAPGCSLTLSLTSPTNCVCTAYAGTFSQSVTGNTNSPGPNQYFLCYGDQLNITANGDYGPSQDFTVGWSPPPAPVYDPGIWLMNYSCPPSIPVPGNILPDPCLVGTASSFNGSWSILNNAGGNFTTYFVPLTMYSMVGGIYAVSINGGNWCYDLGPVYQVTYLNQIVANSVEDCFTGEVTTTITGGMPAFNGSNFNIVPGTLTPANASFNNTSCANGGSIVISGLNNGDVYSYQVMDNQNCPVNVTGTYSGATPSAFVYPQTNYCIGAPNPAPTLTVGTPNTGTFSVVPAGLSINPTTGMINLAASTPGSYTVTYTSSGICPTQTNAPITINAAPTITLGNQSICAGGTASFSANPTPAGTYNYTWTVPAGATNPGNTNLLSTSVAGNYSIQVLNTSTNCSSNAANATLTVNPIPTVTLADQVICVSGTATLTAVPGQTGTTSYTWTVPAGVPPPGNVASFSTSIAGNYSVQIMGTGGCLSQIETAVVSIISGPTVSVNNATVCAGSTATLTATPAVANTYNHVWTVPAGATDPGNVASFSSTIAGNYSVQITLVGANCPSSPATGVITVNPLPTVSVNNAAVCSGASSTITATPGTAGVYSYVWTVPAGVPPPGDVSSISASIAGAYTVQITNPTTLCTSTSASGTLTVNPIPVVTVADVSYCTGILATVTAVPGQAGTTNYSWSVPAGVPPPGNVASFTTNVTGMYIVEITGIGGCISIPDTALVSNDSGPIVAVNDETICAGANATLAATPALAGTYTYSWTVPAGVPPPGDVPTFSTGVAGNYDVYITDVNSGCGGAIATGTVIVNPLPTVTVNSPTTCAGIAVNMVASPGVAGAYSYAWTVPAGVPPPGDVAAFSTDIAGNYDVVITDLTTLCSSVSASGVLVVNPNPSSTVNDDAVCDGMMANLTATPGVVGVYDYAWTVPVGAVDPGNVASFSTTIAGAYTVVLTDPATSCFSQSAVGNVVVYPLPLVDAGPDQLGCDNDNFTLTASGAGVGGMYVWSNAVIDGVPFSQNVGSQIYTVTGTDANGCVATDAAEIIVDATPVASFNYVVDGICNPVTVTFTNTSSPLGTNCIWTFDDGSSVNDCGPVVHTFNQAGSFGVNLQVESLIAGCVANQYLANIVDVEDYPIAGFVYSPEELSTLYNEVTFSNTSTGAVSFDWDFGDYFTSNQINPIHTYPQDVFGNFEVLLIAYSASGCPDTARAIIEIPEELIYYVPNAFTPDNNEFNPIFKPVFTSGFEVEEYNLMIFDRWGEVVFESKDADFGWDGTYIDSRQCQDGVYVWKITFRTEDNNERNFLTGHVNLLR